MIRTVATLAAVMLAGCATTPPSIDVEPHRFERADDVRRLSCYQGDDFVSRLASSDRVVAPDGSRFAWSEVQAIASQPGDETTRACRNISRLWVAEEDGEPRLIFEQNPGAEGRNGNSIAAVGWSEDGERLLFELDTWTYYTDRDPPVLAVWNAANDRVEQVSIAPAMLARRGECSFSLTAHGFTPNGRVLVTTAPLPADEARGLPPCAPQAERWAVALDGSIEPQE